MTKSVQLPPLPDHTHLSLPLDGRRVIIVGANGTGKTRFADSVIDRLSDRAVRLTALDAVCPPVELDNLAASIDTAYASVVSRMPILNGNADTRLDKAIALLLCEELQSLFEHKFGNGSSPDRSLPATRLDMLARAWHEIFPDNRILVKSGELTFSNTAGDSNGYSSIKLSNGEKAVLYAIAVTLLAPTGTTMFVDTPDMFLHPSVTAMVWDRLEELRPDCSWIYITHDVDFLTQRYVSSRVVWVRSFDAEASAWDYTILPPDATLSDELLVTLIGARSSVLFIEGDAKNSIDAKLYPLVFKGYTVRSVGSCDKVVEATRTFNDFNQLHHLSSHGIVDRDRRSEHEVAYLRRRCVFVPEVAEVENLLMLEPVIRAVAQYNRQSPDKAFAAVKRKLVAQFRADLNAQALQHTRHRVKRLMECRADGKFNDINALEAHIAGIIDLIKPRRIYEQLCREFRRYADSKDYAAILRVYNQKSMLVTTNVATACGLHGGKDAYIAQVLKILKRGGEPADAIRSAVIRCFDVNNELSTGI